MKVIHRFLALFMLFTVISCSNKYFSITKRHHNKGYYTDWHHSRTKNPTKNSPVEEKRIPLTDENTVLANNSSSPFLLPREIATKTVKQAENSIVLARPSEQQLEEPKKNKGQVFSKKTKHNNTSTSSTGSGGATMMEPIGLAGFIAMVFGFILSAIMLTSLGSLVGLIALILSIVSIQRHTREFGRYSGVIFPQIVLWFWVISFFLSAFLLLLFALIFTSVLGTGYGIITVLLLIFAGICILLGYLILRLLLRYARVRDSGGKR